MTLQTTMTFQMKNNSLIREAFTLFELVIVLAIISAMVTVTVPYATRSNRNLKIKQQSLNIAELAKYAIELAADIKRPVRLTINTKQKSYQLEIATEANYYQPVDGFLGSVRYIDKTVRIMDITGFDMQANNCYLVFDPAGQWPDADFSLVTADLIETISIRGRRVEIEESTI